MATNERLFVAKFTIVVQYVWKSSRIVSYLFLSPVVKVIKIYVAEIYFFRLYRLLTFAEMGRTGFKHVTCDRIRPGTEGHLLVPLVPSWTLFLCSRGWCWTISWSDFDQFKTLNLAHKRNVRVRYIKTWVEQLCTNLSKITVTIVFDTFVRS